jgi:hypothetical protein
MRRLRKYIISIVVTSVVTKLVNKYIISKL